MAKCPSEAPKLNFCFPESIILFNPELWPLENLEIESILDIIGIRWEAVSVQVAATMIAGIVMQAGWPLALSWRLVAYFAGWDVTYKCLQAAAGSSG